jgi:hypothetical protein
VDLALVDIVLRRVYDYGVRLATIHRCHSAATPVVSFEMQAADRTGRCSMQEKKQRRPAGAAARRRVRSASAQAADVASATEQVATFDERVGSPATASDEAVRTRAYYLFLERGARSGHELDDWLRAEREIRA